MLIHRFPMIHTSFSRGQIPAGFQLFKNSPNIMKYLINLSIQYTYLAQRLVILIFAKFFKFDILTIVNPLVNFLARILLFNRSLSVSSRSCALPVTTSFSLYDCHFVPPVNSSYAFDNEFLFRYYRLCNLIYIQGDHLYVPSLDSLSKYLSDLDSFLHQIGFCSFNCSYSLSERVFILLQIESFNSSVCNHLSDTYNRCFKSIFSNLELRLNYTNNHLLNNIKALYCLSVVSHNNFYRNLCRLLLSLALKVVFPNFFYNERSSHYHNLVYLWLLQIEHFANSFCDYATLDLLSPYIASSSKISSYLYDDLRGSVLIGDISPDLSPIQTTNFLEMYGHNFSDTFFSSTFSTYIGDWFISCNYPYLLRMCVPKHSSYKITHGHADLSSFDLCIKDIPFIIDPGRYSYSRHPHTFSQVSPFAHAIALVDNSSPFSYYNDYLHSDICTFSSYRLLHNQPSKLNLFSNLRIYPSGIFSKIRVYDRSFCLSSSELIIEDRFQLSDAYQSLCIQFPFSSYVKLARDPSDPFTIHATLKHINVQITFLLIGSYTDLELSLSTSFSSVDYLDTSPCPFLSLNIAAKSIFSLKTIISI